MKLIWTLTLFIFSSVIFAKDIVLSTHNLYPYGSYPDDQPIKKSASKNFTGIAVDRVRCAFSHMNESLHILVVPWTRAQYLAEGDAVDGFFAGSQNSYRDAYAKKSDIIAEQKWKWYWLKNNPQNPQDMSQLARIGSFRGSNMSKWLEANKYPIYSRPKTTEQLLLQLKSQRIDLFIANNLVAEKLLKKYNMSEQVDSAIIKDKPLHLYITNRSLIDNPTLLKRFNKGLALCYQEQG
ncbi:hypothetical protein CW745_06165 [Psychromonas sp. psych-6C06]|uniref:substrate-binding periplasmic protein n=1 Tax=Psychromonas sp. psych-6C06 TaxID=2058089 RepID=UPI000C3463C2|nr:transporter substrate-binding domain-containing protein [Psychromonas sp. psych-6C06]PKF63008.1 hypothetical protein CW745_06165 [Psychromonas sp. psych-6C06]